MATRSEELDGARIRELFNDLSLELDRAAAVAAFYDGYPLEERDEHLEEFVADIVGAGD